MFFEHSCATPDWRWAKPDGQKTWEDLLIKRLERAKVLLHQESMSSIAADGIVLLALLLTSCCCLHVRAAARAGSDGSAPYKINTKNQIRNPEDNNFIPVIGSGSFAKCELVLHGAAAGTFTRGPKVPRSTCTAFSGTTLYGKQSLYMYWPPAFKNRKINAPCGIEPPF
jgi:hypothetical protein